MDVDLTEIIVENIQIYEECPICLELLDHSKENISLGCNHTYHKKCIRKWMKNKCTYSCPVCKKEYETGIWLCNDINSCQKCKNKLERYREYDRTILEPKREMLRKRMTFILLFVLLSCTIYFGIENHTKKIEKYYNR
ncbi:MAG TPA: RING finger domain-containing protein [Allocoleopsis sp.]